MNGRQLHRLALYLADIGRQASLEPGDVVPAPGEIAVLDDVMEHPGSSVREITERTGFVQSHVSTSVARLVDRGLLSTSSDSTDRRRTLAYPTDMLRRAIARRTARPVDDALADRLGDAANATRAVELLDELFRLLQPPA
ncbi:MarR family transcriptional regulator [Nocardia sp. CA-120079]|uniref:MarR family transcriptional regulator n=1 Tax=Nocardia sp. CA-120079 TaxID=3239974 RepID=UPI003D992490